MSGEENERTLVIKQTSLLNSLFKIEFGSKVSLKLLICTSWLSQLFVPWDLNFESNRNFQVAKGRPSSDEGLTLETSAFQLFTVANLRFQLRG